MIISTTQLRFYMMCALLEKTGAQTREIARRLATHPNSKIVDHLGKNTRRAQQERNFEIQFGSAALKPNQTGEGLTYDREVYAAICQEVKNWAVVTGQDEATVNSIRSQYMSGGIHPWVGIVWDICDSMDMKVKDVCREVVRNSPQAKAFRAA